MTNQSKRYDDVARLLEDAELHGVRYQEFGRRARLQSADAQPAREPHEPAASVSAPQARSMPAFANVKVTPPLQPRAQTVAQPSERERPSLRPVAPTPSAISEEPCSRESLRATFSRLVARAPEPPPRKLELGLDLPPREAATSDSGRRDERLSKLFSRLKGTQSEDGSSRKHG